MMDIFIGIVFLIVSFVFYYNTEEVLPRTLRIILSQIVIFVGLFYLNLGLGILK